MGTRADFYVGVGENANWIGSIAWDAYPSGIPESIRMAKTEDEFRVAVSALYKRDDVTLPSDGWPWPWDDSLKTDWAYCFDGDGVKAFCFGRLVDDAWKNGDDGAERSDGKSKFPDMSSRASVAF